MPLTDVAIRNAKPREKPHKVGDTLGLFLLVQPSGGKLWRVKCRIAGKEKKLAIGIYPQVGLTHGDTDKVREAYRRRAHWAGGARRTSFSSLDCLQLAPGSYCVAPHLSVIHWSFMLPVCERWS